MQDELDYFESCFRQEDLTAADVENLRGIIQSTSFKRAVRRCLEGIHAKEQQLVGADLATPEGIANAQRTQGEVRGMQFVVSELYAIAMTETEDEKENSDGDE